MPQRSASAWSRSTANEASTRADRGTSNEHRAGRHVVDRTGALAYGPLHTAGNDDRGRRAARSVRGLAAAQEAERAALGETEGREPAGAPEANRRWHWSKHAGAPKMASNTPAAKRPPTTRPG